MFTIIAYILIILLSITAYLNKSKLLSLYFGLLLFCDASGWLRQQLTDYPKPYTGIGFILFSITTILFLAIPMLTFEFSYYSFHKKIHSVPILGWISACIVLLCAYPEVRGESMLNAFYAYYLVGGISTFIWFLSKVKQKFSVTQGVLFLGSIVTIINILIAKKEVNVFHLEYWLLIAACNCIYYAATIVFVWLNRFVKRLLPE